MELQQELERLNEYQKAAVLNDSKACLVNACVGSGKTTVLVNKVHYLYEDKKIPLEKMLVLTFTNKAANEIMERMGKQEEPLIGTFHSVALWLLRNELSIEKYGFTKDFLVIEPDEELDIAMMVITEHKLTIKYKNRLKKRLEKAMSIREEEKKVSRYQDDIFVLVSLLMEEKQRQNKMSFYDLLYYCEMLQRDRKEYPSYIIVDEVQDCDQNQLDFIQSFMGEKTHLFAVGDPNQVIYSWRGGDLNVFYRMKHLFDAEELHLPINYRSSSSILEAARCFLQNGDVLEGSREQGAKIVIKKQYDSFQDANYIAERIKQLHKDGLKLSEIAIFYRLQSQAEIFTKVFEREGIPYQISQKKTIRDIPVLNWLLKILHVCVNPKDKTSLYLAITDKEFGCNMTEAKLRKTINEQKNPPLLYDKLMHFQDSDVIEGICGSFYDEYEEDRNDKECREYNKENFIQYFDLKSHLHPTSADYQKKMDSVNQFLDIMFSYIIDKQNTLDLHTVKMEKKVKLFLDDMLAFVNSTALQGIIMPETNKGYPIQNELQNQVKGKNEIYNQDETYDKNGMQKQNRQQDDYVNLMTLHASKGLEFSQVFITGVNYGWIPMQSKDEKDEEEERRLFFVGITRAKDRLEMSYYTNPGSVRVMSGPSRYVEMIPKRLIESDDLVTTAKREDPQEQNKETDIFKLQNLRKQIQIEQMKKSLAHSTMGAILGSLNVNEDKEAIKNDVNVIKKNVINPELQNKNHVDTNELYNNNPHKVRHEKYGIGEVIKEDDMMITVNFENFGEKEFVKMLTKLEEV